MELLAAKATAYLIRHDYVEEQNAEWCHYMLIKRMMSVISFILLVPLGALVVGWIGSFLYTITFRFLRARTGGYHARTPHGCLIASTCVQTLFLFLSTRMNQPIGLVLITAFSCFAIALMGPANHPELHLDKNEMEQLRPRIYIRLALVAIAFFCLLVSAPSLASCVSFAVLCVAVMLFISLLGCGAQ